jgi:ribosomal protein S18 acetylase RimI-like enzyme
VAIDIRTAGTPQEREAALRLLSHRLDPTAQEESVSQTLQSAEQGALSFDFLVVAVEADKVLGASWLVVSEDFTGHIFPPEVIEHEHQQLIWDDLAQHIASLLDDSGCWIGQILLHPDEVTQRQRLDDSPFAYLADLQFMSMSFDDETTAISPPTKSVRLEATSYQEGRNETLFVDVMEQTYEGSLDFPEVNEFRTAEEAFHSHRTHSQIQPHCWQVFYHKRRPAGMLLLSPGQDDHWEITYMGVCGSVRGQGIGHAMLSQAIATAKKQGAQGLSLGVDSRNHYAIKLYEAYGFRVRTACHFYAWFPHDEPEV